VNQIISIIFILSMSGICMADQGLDELKNSFKTSFPDYQRNVEAVSKLKPLEVKLGSEISKNDCEFIANKARFASVIDPFVFTYEGGSSEVSMCGGWWGWQKNFIVQQSGKTSLGIPYNFIIQVRSSRDEEKDLFYTNYFFDSGYRVVYIESLYYDYKGKLHQFTIQTKDQSGNYLNNYFDVLTGYPQKDVTGSTSIQIWIPADGSVASSILRKKIVDSKDPNHNFETWLLTRTDKKDWESFELPLTHSWSGGYFKYDGKYYSHPRNRSWLMIKSKDGKEVCSFGDTLNAGRWISYPADSNAYYSCSNF